MISSLADASLSSARPMGAGAGMFSFLTTCFDTVFSV